MLASAVSKSVPGWGLNASSNSSLQGLSGSAASLWSPNGYREWAERTSCYLATSASHLFGDWKTPPAAYHTCGPSLAVRLVIGPSGRAGLAWDTLQEWAEVLDRES